VVRLDDWSCKLNGDCVLRGRVYGHPDIEDGTIIETDPVKSMKGRTIETEKEMFRLGRIDPKYRRWLRCHRPRWDWRNPLPEKES